MRFSILIPVYNVEDYIRECLDSLIKQSYKDFEVILVDDGSTDKSGIICDEYKKKGELNITVIHKKNEGLISARRTGIKNAHGDYCIFCDSDDFLESNALKILNDIILKYGPDVIIFNAFVFNGVNKVPFFSHVLQEGIVGDKEKIYEEFCLSYKLNAIWLKTVKRKIIDVERDYSCFYKYNYGEDLLQSIPIIKKASKIYYLDKELYDYRLMSGMTNKYSDKYYKSYKAVYNEMKKQLKNEKIINFEDKLSYYLVKVAYGAITQIKYASQLNVANIEYIFNDNDFKKSWNMVRKSKVVHLGIKEKLILALASKQRYNLIWIILKIKEKIKF